MRQKANWFDGVAGYFGLVFFGGTFGPSSWKMASARRHRPFTTPRVDQGKQFRGSPNTYPGLR
jgi:hypothetical protein